MRQQLIITHQHTVLKETEKNMTNPTDQQLSMLHFYENIRTSNFLWTQHLDRRCVCNETV
jgi:hypothetical protein